MKGDFLVKHNIKSFNGEADKKEINSRISDAHSEFLKWSKLSFDERANFLHAFAQNLEKSKHEISRLISLEMGKVFSESVLEIEKSIDLCYYFAENSKQILSDEIVNTRASESYVSFEPLGVVFAVMPWNFPVWQVLRLAVPAIMAGNTIVLKPASNVLLTSYKLQQLFVDTFTQHKVFSVVPAPISEIETFISNDRIKAIALTGSDEAGSSIAALAGKHLKKITLELGGSDALVVYKDANLKKCAERTFQARLRNCGQTCTAPKRIFVEREVYDEFVKLQSELLRKVKVGDPFDPLVNCGPLAKSHLLENLNRQIESSLEIGAKEVAKVQEIPEGGNYFAPRILINVTEDMPVFQEEVFGPVWVIVPFDSEQELINLVNNSKFGLAASIWTQDIPKAKQLSKNIEVGSVFINSVTSTVSELPFGGMKRSGYGRELSKYGMKEFVNIKAIWVD